MSSWPLVYMRPNIQVKPRPRPDDLSSELNRVYKEHFAFKGSFQHISGFPNAPNPGLTIEGVGLVGLPLSEHDAKLIIAEGSKPSPTTSSTTTTTPTRSIEFSPSQISFNNPGWSTFVSEQACKRLWKILGGPLLTAMATRPRCQLVKATLHKPGSSSPDTKDARKPDGTFATVAFVLPSVHVGGQVHLSEEPTVLDTSKDSGSKTYVLAWYNGMNHSVQPVTSGYRLALVYDLIHTSPNIPLPSLPSVPAATAALTAVLQKWHDGGYKQQPDIPLAAFVLEDRGYEELKVEDLQDMDAHLLKCLLPAAEGLSFCVGLAQLKKTVKGKPHRDHWTYTHIDGYAGYPGADAGYEGDWFEDQEGYQRGDYDTPDMGEVTDEDHDVSNFNRVDGKKAVNLGDFLVDKDNLVPRFAFDMKWLWPDDASFDQHIGRVIHEYDKAVAIVFRAEDETDVMVRTKGAFMLLKQLEASSKPTPLHKAVVESALERLEGKKPQRRIRGEFDNATAAMILLGHAVRWKDQTLWKKIIPHCKSAPRDTLISAITSAVKVFKTDAIKQSLDDLMTSYEGFQAKLDMLKAISDSSNQNSDAAWVNNMVKQVLSSHVEPKATDIPALVSVAEHRGPEILQTTVLMNIKSSESYDFLVALANALLASHDKPTTPPALKLPFSQVIRQCVSLAVPQWEPAGYYYNPWQVSPKPKRIADLVELCLAIGDLGLCTHLFRSVLLLDNEPTKTVTKDRVAEILIPLIPLLYGTLAKFGIPMTAEPFASFLKCTISLYLSQILGEKMDVPPLPWTGNIGDGCADCAQLNAFLRSADPFTNFKAPQARRSHVEATIKQHRAYLDRIVTTETMKGMVPHCLVVSRRPEVLEALMWMARQGAAMAFLGGVAGNEQGLRMLMGERYEDVVSAVNGTKAFVLGSLEIAGAVGSAQSVPGGSGAVKRKRPETSPGDPASATTKRKEVISKVLRATCNFEGNYYHASSIEGASSPGISISGVGPISLPVTDRDAKLIAGLVHPSAANPNQTNAGVLQVDVEGSKISFSDPAWKRYVEELVSSKIWPTLSGGSQHTPELQCELVKATLLQPGAFSQETVDSPKPDGTFATLTFVLPSISERKGGELCLSTGDKESPVVLDPLKNGSYSTSVFAWYNGLPYSVQPIASGNRLSLTYNIIVIPPNYPRPSLPSFSRAVDLLVAVLKMWKAGEFRQPVVPIIAYTLTSSDIQGGRVEAFESADAIVIKSVSKAAKQLGFAVGLANMTRSVFGIPVQEHWTYPFVPESKRGGYHWGTWMRQRSAGAGELRKKYYAGEYDTPPMESPPHEEIQDFTDFVRIDGGETSELKAFAVKRDSMVTNDSVRNAPDEHSFDPWTGTVKHHFKRAALILYPESEEIAVLVGVASAATLLEALKVKEDPTPRAVKIVSAIVDRLEKASTDGKSLDGAASQSALSVLQLARQWKLPEVWSKAAPLCKDADTALVADEVTLGIEGFRIKGIRPGLTGLLQGCRDLHSQYELLEAIRRASPKDAKSTQWADEVIANSLCEYAKYDTKDAPALVSLSGERGLDCLKKLLQSLPKNKAFDFSIALMEPLGALRSSPQSPKAEVDELICTSATSAIDHLDHGLESEDRTDHWRSSTTQTAKKKVKRVCEFVDACIVSNSTFSCILLLVKPLFTFRPDEDIAKTFEEIHFPLIPQLKTTLTNHKIHLTAMPFDKLFRITISTYLERVLGPKPPSAPPLPERVGCGQCYECRKLSDFVLGPSERMVTEQHFKVAQAKRTHLQSQIRDNRTLALHVRTQTLKSTSPHTLVVRKSTDAQAGAVWNAHRERAEALVKSVSEEKDVVYAIMGDSVWKLKALDGSTTNQEKQTSKRSHPEASSSGVASKKRKLG